jgi:hypothetical protein
VATAVSSSTARRWCCWSMPVRAAYASDRDRPAAAGSSASRDKSSADVRRAAGPSRVSRLSARSRFRTSAAVSVAKVARASATWARVGDPYRASTPAASNRWAPGTSRSPTMARSTSTAAVMPYGARSASRWAERIRSRTSSVASWASWRSSPATRPRSTVGYLTRSHALFRRSSGSVVMSSANARRWRSVPNAVSSLARRRLRCG